MKKNEFDFLKKISTYFVANLMTVFKKILFLVLNFSVIIICKSRLQVGTNLLLNICECIQNMFFSLHRFSSVKYAKGNGFPFGKVLCLPLYAEFAKSRQDHKTFSNCNAAIKI